MKTTYTRFIIASILLLGLLSYGRAYAGDAGVVVVDAGVVAVATPAPAAAPTKPKVSITLGDPVPKVTALSKLSSDIMDILIPALLLLFGSLVSWILNWVRKKFHLNVSDAQITQWRNIAGMAADRGAEWGRNKAKSLTDNKEVPGPEVLAVAVDWAIEMGRAFNLPELGREKLIGLIESRLPQRRAENV